MRHRPPAVAGTFYPAQPEVLRAQILGFLAEAEPGVRPHEDAPKALIAPHAGTIYSGPVAASAYARLRPIADRVERVVLLGPSHRVAMRGLAAPSVDAFDTPLGAVPVDVAAVADLVARGLVHVDDEAHRREHSLEVHLPFLQAVLPTFELVPLVVGPCPPSEVSAALDAVWGGPETLIVVSSDLSHYHPYLEARALDGQTTRQIEALAWRELDGDGACGYHPVRGLLYAAERHHLHAVTVDLRSSGDTAGTRDEVVGYGAYLFH